MNIKLVMDKTNLLNLVHAGHVAKGDLKRVMRTVANGGRTHARRLIRTQFVRRSGRMAREAANMRAEAIVKPHVIEAKVSRLPHLLNVFENGATLKIVHVRPKNRRALKFTNGYAPGFARGSVPAGGAQLAAKPVMQPSLRHMETLAQAEIGWLLARIAQR